jgi:hypothetical protein
MQLPWANAINGSGTPLIDGANGGSGPSSQQSIPGMPPQNPLLTSLMQNGQNMGPLGQLFANAASTPLGRAYLNGGSSPASGQTVFPAGSGLGGQTVFPVGGQTAPNG